MYRAKDRQVNVRLPSELVRDAKLLGVNFALTFQKALTVVVNDLKLQKEQDNAEYEREYGDEASAVKTD